MILAACTTTSCVVKSPAGPSHVCSRAADLAVDVLRSSKLDDVPSNEKKAGEPQVADNLQLVLEPGHAPGDGGLGADAALAADNLVDALDRDADVLGELDLREPHGNEEPLEEDLAGRTD